MRHYTKETYIRMSTMGGTKEYPQWGLTWAQQWCVHNRALTDIFCSYLSDQVFLPYNFLTGHQGRLQKERFVLHKRIALVQPKFWSLQVGLIWQIDTCTTTCCSLLNPVTAKKVSQEFRMNYTMRFCSSLFGIQGKLQKSVNCLGGVLLQRSTGKFHRQG